MEGLGKQGTKLSAWLSCLAPLVVLCEVCVHEGLVLLTGVQQTPTTSSSSSNGSLQMFAKFAA